MLFKTAFVIAAFGTAALASPAAQPQALPPQGAPAIKRQESATPTTATAQVASASAFTIQSAPTASVAGTFAFTNLQTVNQFGMTTLDFAFADAKKPARKGKCGITMIARYNNDVCGYPLGSWNIATTRAGNPRGDWPMNILISEYVYGSTGSGMYRANLTLADPGSKKSPLACKTTTGAVTCTATKPIDVVYTYYPDQ